MMIKYCVSFVGLAAVLYVLFGEEGLNAFQVLRELKEFGNV